MSRVTVATPTTASTIDRAAPRVDNALIESFVQHRMKHFRLTRDEVAKMATEAYGSLELAVQAVGVAEIQAKAGLKEAFPNGIENSQFQIGRKAKRGEEVNFSRLGSNLWIRVWGGDLAFIQSFSFDFVDDQGQYIRTPKDVEIYSMPTAFTPPIRVLSIEQSLEAVEGNSPAFSHSSAFPPFFDQRKYQYDAQWETYVVPEGIGLRIKQHSHGDHILIIPTRSLHSTATAAATPTTLVLQPSQG